MPLRQRRCENWIKSFMDMLRPFCIANEQYQLWSAIAVLSPALRKNVYLPFGANQMFMNTYTVLIGPSGNGKSEAAKVGFKLIKEAGVIDIITDSISGARLMEVMAEKMYPDEFGVLRPQGHLFVYADELQTLLPKGVMKEGHLPAHLCTLYDCPESHENRLVTRADRLIKDPYLAILGNTTRTGLNETFTHLSWQGGFVTRSFFIIGGHPKKILQPAPQPDYDKWMNLVEDLQDINRLSGELSLNQEALDGYNAWYEAFEAPNGEDAGAAFRRRHGYTVLKLAGILSVAAGNSLVIRKQDIDQATILFNQLANNVDSLSPTNVDTVHADNMLRLYRTMKEKKIVGRPDLMSSLGRYMRGDQFDEAMGDLEEIGAIYIDSTRRNLSGNVLKMKVEYHFVKEVEWLENAVQ